jgi:uncharacterized protein DUF2510
MAAPGWYDDPNAPGGKRWWDGSQWTEHTAAAQPAAPAAAPQPPAAPAATATATPPGGGYHAPYAGTAAATAEPKAPYPTSRMAVAAIAALFGLLLIVGSIGTWVSAQTTGPFHIGASRGGLDRDGAITLAIAVVALVLIVIWAARLGPPAARMAVLGSAAGLAFIALIIVIADIIDVGNKATAIVDTSVGWGLWLCLIASVGLLATTVVGTAVRSVR